MRFIWYQRKPIYDDIDIPSTNTSATLPPKADPINTPLSSPESEPKPRGPTPTDRLAEQIGHARMFLYRFATGAEDKLNQTMDSAFHLEKSFTETIASLAPPRETGEKLMPGTIYVLVAAMAGSILTRNRNILLRASMPIALGIGAGWVVLPVTMRNVADLMWKYEEKFPAVADSHVRFRDGIQRGVRFAKVHTQLGANYIDEKVTDAREAVEGWVRKGK